MANEFKIENGLIVSGKIIATVIHTSGSNIGTPEMYGARGDGVTDDQLAIHHALISHSIVELDAKTYAIRGWMGMPSHRIFRGKGKDVTTLKLMDNSPYGYSGQVYLIEGTFQQDTLYWYGSSVGTTTGTGSIDVDHRNTTIMDQSPLSPFYRQEQTQSWAGLGYWSHDSAYGGLVGARRDVTIENMTIDCNFNNQARHVSWNHSDNPSSASNGGSGYYIPQYSWKVRPTIHAIVLQGENIRVDNVKVINYGYGVSHASAGPINYSDLNTLPFYNENFPILITGNRNSSYTSSNTNDPISDVQGNSKFRGNYVTNTEILGMGNLDLMNPVSNTTAIVCNNHSVFCDGVYRSTFPNEGGIYNCTVDPGEYVMPATASFSNGVYLDAYQSRSLSGSYPSLFEKLVYDPVHSQTGSNGDFALSYGSAGIYSPYLKKISGSWYPAGNAYSTNRHIVNAYCGFRVFNCVARNVAMGFYHDSWMGNYFIENNQFLDVDNGFRTVVSDIILTSSYNNVVFKNNYVKLAAHNRAYVPGHSVVFYGIDRSVGSGSLTRHIDNLVIEDNIFELPISSSTNIYGLGKFAFREYPRYVGVWFTSETSPSGSYPHLHRGVSFKNNSFVNWNPVKSELITGGEAYGYNLPFFFNYSTSSADFDTSDNPAGPFPNSLIKFKNKTLSNYIIEGNIYNDSIYPSTSSLVPITFHMVGTGNQYYYPVDQVSRLGSVTATTLANGNQVLSSGNYSHAEGSLTTASGDYSHAEGIQTKATGQGANSKGGGTLSSGAGAHSEGIYTTASANYSHAEGHLTEAASQLSHAEGSGSWAGYSIFTGLPSAAGIASHAEGLFTRTSGVGSHSEGSGSIAAGVASHAEGQSTIASGIASHAEGSLTTASGDYSHAEGVQTKATGQGANSKGGGTLSSGAGAHSEGYYTTASMNYSHAEGAYTIASSVASHAEGSGSWTGIDSFGIPGVSSEYSHAEGLFTRTGAVGAHAEGSSSLASGIASHAEGFNTTASGQSSHAEGLSSISRGSGSHAEGFTVVAHGHYSHAEGYTTLASGSASHAEGGSTVASGIYAHAEGVSSWASGSASHAEGSATTASGHYSHAEGYATVARGEYSHAEGNATLASGSYSHAEGNATLASGSYSHAEGNATLVSGDVAHAEGSETVAIGNYSHAEGGGSVSQGLGSHAEGSYTNTLGYYSHAEGQSTTASAYYQHVSGKYNVASANTNDLFIIGNGTAVGSRSNIVVVNTSSVIVSGNISSSGISALNITSSNISASGFVSASTVAAATSVTSPIGNFTNLTASNVSASGFVSASTIRAVTSMTSPIGNFTNLTASNISSSGTSSLNVIEISASSNILYKIGKGSAIHSAIYTGELVIANVNPALSTIQFPLVISQSRVGVYAVAPLSTYFRAASGIDSMYIAEETGLFVNGTIISNDSFQISASSKITSAGVTTTIGSNTIMSEYTSNGYRSAFYDYFVSSGSNIRSGNITSCWSGSTISYYETVTVDIGNTDQVTMSVILQTPLGPSPQSVLLKSNSTITGDWTVKAIARYI